MAHNQRQRIDAPIIRSELTKENHNVPVAQLDRASASGAEGYRFEPYRAYQLINNLAGLPLPDSLRGQTGDKFSVGGLPWPGYTTLAAEGGDAMRTDSRSGGAFRANPS